LFLAKHFPDSFQTTLFFIKVKFIKIYKKNGCLKSGQQISFIWAAKLLLWAAKIIFFGQRNYFFEQQILMGKAANFTGIGSNFCSNGRQIFLMK
jgi:hypothetical protein